jgi:hypothetical protein
MGQVGKQIVQGTEGRGEVALPMPSGKVKPQWGEGCDGTGERESEQLIR